MKKGGIELYRFVMTNIVCLHHFRLYSEALPYGGGYLAVDFFFILSGYLLCRHYKKTDLLEGKSPFCKTIRYIKERYIRLFPQYLSVLLISVILTVQIVEIKWSSENVFAFLLKFFMLDCFAPGVQISIMPQGWYCSSLLIASALMYYLYSKNEKIFKKIFAPSFSIGIYLVFLLKYGHLNLYTQYGYIVTIGTFRAIAGLCLGSLLENFLGDRTIWPIKGKIINWSIFLAATVYLLYALLWDNGYDKGDLLVLLFFVIVLLYLLGDTDVSAFFSTPFFEKLGEMSYTMFLIHYTIAVFFSHFGWGRSYDWKIVSILYLLLVFMCSKIVIIAEKKMRLLCLKKSSISVERQMLEEKQRQK